VATTDAPIGRREDDAITHHRGGNDMDFTTAQALVADRHSQLRHDGNSVAAGRRFRSRRAARRAAAAADTARLTATVTSAPVTVAPAPPTSVEAPAGELVECAG
jgi:hypothetical protein